MATIANCLRDSFAPLVELLVPTLLKQVGAASSVVMTSAANKAMMVVLASASPDSGFTRAIPMLIEGCSSKSPSNRQHSIDFLAVCGSLWTTDAFDRLLTAIRHVLENGVVDKSPEVRRSARRLFWVLFDRRSSIWRESMQQMLRSVDSSTRKAILIECFPHLGSGGGASTSGSAQLAGLGSNEIRDLLLRVCPNNASTDLLQSDAPPASQSEGIVKAASATRTVRAKPVKAPYAATISSFDTREAEITSAADISEPVPSVAAAVHTHNKTDVKPMKPSATSLAPAPAPAPEATPIALAKTGPVRLGGGARRLNAPSSKNIVPSGAPTMVARPLSQTMEVVPSSNYSDIDTAGPDGTVTGTRRMSVADFMKTVDRNVSASMESRDSDSGVDSTVSSDVTSTEPKRGSASAVGRIVGVSSSTAKPAIESSASTSGGLAGGARRMFVPPTTAVREAPSSVSELSHASCVSMHPTTKNEQIPAVAVNKAMTRSMQQTSDQWDSNTNTIPSAPTRVAGDIMSIDDARKLLGDSSKHWESRVAAVESLQLRLTQLVNGECSYAPELWDVLDGVTVGLTDVHHRVTSEALNSIALFIDNFHTLCPDASLGSASGANSAANFNYLCVMKFISSCLPELFQRLLDQRPHIRGIANTLLNSVRITIDPVMVVTAIVPKISEVPDKVKTAVTQFLLVIVPHCGQYFAVPVHSATFLGRMALVLGSSTSKPSVTLMQSGTRLMEMVYKVCPQFICLQLALLPLQQQLVLKKVLQSSIPDIDALVTAAGKDFNRNRDSFSAQDRPSTLSSTSGPKVSLLSWQDIASSGSVRNRKPIARSGSATSVSSASSVLSSGSRCKPAVPSRSSKPNIGIRTANSAVSAPGEKKKENLLPTRAPAPPPVHAPVQPLYEDDAECYPTDDPSGAESIDRRDLYERSSEYSVASQPRPVGDMGSTVDSQKSQESEDDHHADFSSLGSAHEIYDTRASDSTLTSTQELQPSPIQSLGSDQRSGGMFSEANYVRTPTDLLPSGFRQSLSHSMSQSSVTSAVQLTAVDPTAYECSSISMDKVTDGPARSPVTSTSTVSAMSQQEVLVSPSGANKGQFVIIPDMRTAAGTPSHTTPKFDAAPHQGHSSSKPSTFHTPGRSHGHGQSQTRDISWLLIALQISSESNTKLEGLKELKQLAKQHGREQNEFWKNNCGQVSDAE